MAKDITHADALAALKQPGVFDLLRDKIVEAVDAGSIVRPPELLKENRDG